MIQDDLLRLHYDAIGYRRMGKYGQLIERDLFVISLHGYQIVEKKFRFDSTHAIDDCIKLGATVRNCYYFAWGGHKIDGLVLNVAGAVVVA